MQSADRHNRKRHRRSPKAIVTTLLGILISLSTVTTAFAYNNDDIRRLLGKPEVDTVEFHDYLDYVDSLTQEAANSNTDGLVENKTATALKDSLLGRVKRMEETRATTQQELAKELKSGKLLYEVQDLGQSIYTITKSLDSFKLADYFSAFEEDGEQHEASWYFDKDNIATIENQVEYARTLTNDSYDIGGIGTQKQYPLTGTLEPTIEVSTGFRGLRDGTLTNGTYFTYNSNPKEQAAIALFNGVVTKVEHSDTWGNWVEIQSGKGLRISYSFLGDVKVSTGQSIAQGDIISIGTQAKEVYIEAQLDNQYINPCILIGNDGIKAHNRWYNLNPGDRGEAQEEVYRQVPQKTTSSIWTKTEFGTTNRAKVEDIEETTEAINGWGE